MHALEERRQQLARDVVQHVERAHRVERARRELDRGQVALYERRLRHARARTPQLLLGEVDARQVEALRELARLDGAVAAAELDDVRALREPLEQALQPLATRIVCDRR